MDIYDFILAGITGLGGFLFGARKQQKEVDSISIQNVASSLAVYQDIIEDLRKQIGDMQRKIEEMEKVIHSLEEENKKLRTLIQEK
jgi:peptidoglycan hydrolase CwlO-like protein